MHLHCLSLLKLAHYDVNYRGPHYLELQSFYSSGHVYGLGFEVCVGQLWSSILDKRSKPTTDVSFSCITNISLWTECLLAKGFLSLHKFGILLTLNAEYFSVCLVDSALHTWHRWLSAVFQETNWNEKSLDLSIYVLCCRWNSITKAKLKKLV